jgi:RNA ligase
MKINIELLKKNIEDGYIIRQKHPSLDLTIYNYSQSAQYDNHWDEITLMCRGLILDSEYNIIQRPFGKFFNKDEHDSEYKPNIPNLPFEVYDKMDGSLGILYWDAHDGYPKIASRGSFTSEQAMVGTKMLHELYSETFNRLDKSKTYIFEIIYTGNRIVLDYGDTNALVLLGIIDTATGKDLSLESIGFPIVERFDVVKDFDKLQALNTPNKEGFVIKFSNGFRMKLKFDEYCRLHRIITNVTSYDIWECLRNGTGFDEMLDKVPDEFYDWIKDCETKLKINYTNMHTSYTRVFQSLVNISLKNNWSDKDFALEVKSYKHSGILFLLKNGRSIDDAIWKMIKPKYEKPFNKK